jgi:hypothetical protein
VNGRSPSCELALDRETPCQHALPPPEQDDRHVPSLILAALPPLSSVHSFLPLGSGATTFWFFHRSLAFSCSLAKSRKFTCLTRWHRLGLRHDICLFLALGIRDPFHDDFCERSRFVTTDVNRTVCIGTPVTRWAPEPRATPLSSQNEPML